MRLAAECSRRAVALLVIITTLSCGGDSPTARPTIATVGLSSTSVNLSPGTSAQLTATARTSAGIVLTDRVFAWASVTPTVATVSAAGLVTGVSDGSTSVTVTSEGVSAAVSVAVRTPVSSVVVTPTTAQLIVGGAIAQLSASARDANGATIAGRAIAWSSSNAAIATVSQSGGVVGIAAGTATITAESEGRTGTALVMVAVPDPCLTIRPLTVGQTFSGTLAAADCKLADNSAIQNFTFTLTTETVLEIEMTSTVVDPYLYVLDANGKILAEDDDGGPGINARVLHLFPAGKYFVVANTFDANSYGPFQLTVRLAPAACVAGRAITLPSVVNATLAVSSACRLLDDSYADRYELNLPTRTVVRVDMSSAVIDAFLLLFDANAKLVAQDDDAGPGVNAHIEVQLEAGRYTILANAQPNQVGAYRLDVGVPLDPCAVTRTVTIAQTVTGTLATTDCATGLQGPIPYVQRWALNVPTAGPLAIAMSSTVVDAYLIIQNATTGAVVGENDDAVSGFTNARVAANFPAGQYIVNATTFDLNEVGAYTLSVTTISNATPVGITVAPAALSLVSGQQQQLTATITGSTNAAVTWQTSSTAIATVTTGGLVRAVTPGSATITAQSAADPSRSVTIAVTVTQPSTGTANLDIAAMYIIQSVQQLDGSVKLVANRDAVARVFVRGSRTGIGTVALRLRFFQGATLLQTMQANVTPTLTVDEGCCTADIAIPGSLIRAGVSVLADVDPLNAIAESNETDNNFPLSGTAQALNVVTVPDLNVRLVPIRQNRAGTVGVATQSVMNTLRSVWPLNTVNVTARTALSIDYGLVSTSFDEWGYLVRDLELARRAEGATSYYYGLVRVSYTSGVLGLAGGIPALSAVGVDEASSFGAAEAKLTLAHELGHTFGLRHAPCGGAAGPDPAFPYADGRAGAYGMDIASGNIVKTPNGTDIMGYCSNQWVSVYNYRNVLDLRARNPNNLQAIAAVPVLLISGSVTADAAHIDGSFALTASPTKNDLAGRFMLEGLDAYGRVLFAQQFSPFVVSDGRPDDEAFVLALPVTDKMKATVAQLVVREVNGDRHAMRMKNAVASIGSESGTAVSVRGASGSWSLQWSTTQTPMVLVRNAAGEVIGIGRTGALDMSQFARATNGAGDVELLLTDGVTSVRRTVNPSTGAIRP